MSSAIFGSRLKRANLLEDLGGEMRKEEEWLQFGFGCTR